ncbi:MAG TPA: LON peptidase substrate-binding domain-containing protein [Nevskiaceae bacterium]|nr:LON peptidase substrate-binding domain-containing protein [Nevskiaceae bacterium]
MSEIPIFPLRTVLYPGGRLDLRIFEARYVDMTKACLRDQSPFGVCLIEGGFEVGQPAVPAALGCSARIQEWEVPSPGLFTLHTRGETRFRLRRRRVQADGLILGEVDWLPPPDPLPLPDHATALADLLRQLIETLGADHFPQPPRFEDAAWVAYRLAEILPVIPERKRDLLAVESPAELIEQVAGWIAELQAARDPD